MEMVCLLPAQIGVKSGVDAHLVNAGNYYRSIQVFDHRYNLGGLLFQNLNHEG